MKNRIKNYLTGSFITLVILLVFIALKKVNVVWTISSIFFFLIIIVFILRKEEWFKSHEHSIKFIFVLITILITLFAGYYLTSEFARPLFVPRIMNTEVIPLHIQSNAIRNSFDEIKYYGVYKVEYTIKTPFFKWKLDSFLDLDLPDKVIGESWWRGKESKSELLVYFLEGSPYYTTNITEEGIIDVEENLKNKILINISKTLSEIEEIKATFYLREEIKNGNANLDLSDPEWYSESQIAPLYFNKEFMAENIKRNFAYVILRPQNKIYQIDIIKIKSLTDFEVKGFAIKLDRNDQRICDGELELHNFNGYISINVLPREEKTFLLISNPDNTPARYWETFFELQKSHYDSLCLNLYRNYEKWYREISPKEINPKSK